MADPPCSDIDTRTCSDGLSRSSSQYHFAKIPYFDDNFEHSNASPSILPSSSNFSESDSFYGWQEIEKQINGNLEDLTEHFRNRRTTEPPHYSYSEDNDGFPAIKVHVNGDGQTPLVKNRGSISSPLKDDNEVKEDIPSGIMPLNKGQEPISASVMKGKESTNSIKYPDNASLEKFSLTHHIAKDSFGTRSLNFARSKSCKADIIIDSASPWLKVMEYSDNTPSVGSEKESEGCGRKICTLNFGSSVERLSTKDWQSTPENALDMEIDKPDRKFSTGEDGIRSTPDMREKAELPTDQEITVKPVSSIFHFHIIIYFNSVLSMVFRHPFMCIFIWVRHSRISIDTTL